MKRYKNYFINLICPAFIFGSITGILTSVVVTLFELCVSFVVDISLQGYAFFREHLYFTPIVIVALFVFSYLVAFVYKKSPNLKGGGIPTSIGVLRGIITFKWLRNLLGTFFLSLSTFLIGVPLGNEGPSVQMGTAIGRGSVYTMAKKRRAWDRYSMTGGACAGFSTATGAPISGIMFAIEEAHQRISPMIIIVSSVSVMFARITTEILAPIFNVSVTLFDVPIPVTLEIKDIWIPILVGIVIVFFAVAFLKLYVCVRYFYRKTLIKLPHQYKIFLIYLATFVFGLLSVSFISTGHDLIVELFEGSIAVYMLFLVLIVRSVLTLSANSNSLTGGLFVPILALGALVSSLIGKGLQGILGFEQEYYVIVLILGITACISSMMKMPLTAIFFAVEALSCYDNILYVIIVSAVSFIITEVLGVKSINDTVLDSRAEEQNEGKEISVIDTFVTVKEDAFAIGKQIRDIFWPTNLFVLSLQHDPNHNAEVDEHGGKAIREGDILHVRFSTYDESATMEELMAIVGEQKIETKKAEII